MPDASFAAAVLGTFLDAAFGRIVATREAAASGDADGVLLELHSLKGLCAQAGERASALMVHELEERVATAGPAGSQLASGLARIEAALAAIPGAATAPRTVPATAVLERIVDELRAVAARRGVDLRVAQAIAPGDPVPRRTAGLLFDVLGHLARNAVVHGASAGRVTVRVAIGVAADGVTCTIEDDGTGPPPRREGSVDIDAGRGRGLAAASARVAQAGGRLVHGPTPSGFHAQVWLPPDWLRPAPQG